jgi:hypothetical protein
MSRLLWPSLVAQVLQPLPMPRRIVGWDGGVGLAAFVIPSQPTAHAPWGGTLGPKGSAAGQTRDLNVLVLRDSISGLKATAACRTKPPECHQTVIKAKSEVSRWANRPSRVVAAVKPLGCVCTRTHQKLMPGNVIVPKGSKCFAGLKLMRPSHHAVSSPRR